MTAPVSSAGTAPLETLIARLAGEGYRRAEPAILQPLAPFLDLSGEDIRRRMFTTQDGEGRDWCLRPEFTIPVARDYLASTVASAPAAFAYAGPVFRLRQGEPGEFVQAGLESFGREDAAAADAEIVALTLALVAQLGVTRPVIRMGDIGLITDLLDALSIPAAARRRLLRAIASGAGHAAADALAAPANSAGTDETRHAGLLAALEGQDPVAARVFVEDILAIAGLKTVGGRSATDIAARFLARASERENPVSDETRDMIAAILALAGDPDTVVARLRQLTRDAGVDLAAALDRLEARNGFLAARGVDLGSITFATGFARNLDYYTGLAFELADPAVPAAKPLAGGGRYDHLLRRLGAATEVPAVGASIWIDRVTAARGEAA